jgi:hypothetical protein
MARPKTWTRVVVIPSSLAVGLIVGAQAATPAGPWDGWGCPMERIAMQILELDGSPGAPNEQAAMGQYLARLARDGDITGLDAKLAAFSHAGGPSRFEDATNRVFVDDKIVAEFQISRPTQGTFAVSGVTFCSTPPDPRISSPAPTPSPVTP